MLARAARGTGALLLRGSVQASGRAPRRDSSGLPRNTVVLFVPQQEAWVVERMGRFHRILEPVRTSSAHSRPSLDPNPTTLILLRTHDSSSQGLNILIPVLDRIRYVQSLKEIVINVPEQSAVTLDNVTLQIDGVLYLRIMDPYKASYGVEDPEYAVTQLAQTTMRSELGKLSLDKVFRERESLNASIVDAINQAADCWGIRCLRYEIKDIHVPPRVKESMQMQVEAERRKRATVLESEGTRESAINVAEGKKQAQILASEAEKAEQINQAAGEASAVLAKAKAKAEAIRILAAALTQHNGDAAASLTVAEQYVSAFSKLAKDSNTILLPSNPGDVSSMVAQAMGVYGALTKAPVPGAQDSVSSGSSRDVQGTDASLDEEFDRVKLS
ncbi:stomatin-like protein 2, mitochondrial isoform X1 [Callorhinus ursinus]|uniref:Stomatin-like protein 2, mitochondrial n=1 Tax=Zalophus californianus TaxID=9704 RepID=A0A6J2EQZ3_ZALCA|nr:stomatin-like protein 2, mitochondrial isoform X1 [Zalophus californianus]